MFITADTGFRANRTFFDNNKLVGEPLESLRIPGILILPDQTGPGREVTELFSHEDVLPLLAAMTGVESSISERLRTHSREAIAVSDYDGHTIITATHQYYGSRSLMGIDDYWKLTPVEDDFQYSAPMAMRTKLMEEIRNATWINAGDDVYKRDFRWDLIDSYEIPDENIQPFTSPP